MESFISMIPHDTKRAVGLMPSGDGVNLYSSHEQQLQPPAAGQEQPPQFATLQGLSGISAATFMPVGSGGVPIAVGLPLHPPPPPPTSLPQQQAPQQDLQATVQAHIFQIFDRRVNFNLMPPDASIYSMLRAWVQDDPTRQHPNYISWPKEGVQMALPRPAPETALTLLRTAPKRKQTTEATRVLINSKLSIPTETLLDLHVGYMKQVRRMWQKQRARRYQRFKGRLAALGVGPVPQLERALMSDEPPGDGGHHHHQYHRSRTSHPGITLSSGSG